MAEELKGRLAAAGMARMGRKAALEGEVVSGEQEIAVPLVVRAAARTQAGQRARGEAVLHQK